MESSKLEVYFNQYLQSNEEYKSPNYAFKDQNQEYHFGIFMEKGKGRGYAIFTEEPINEDRKLYVIEQFSGAMSTFTRIKAEYERKVNIDNQHLIEAKSLIWEWAKTQDEKNMAESYVNYIDVLVETHALYLKEFKKLADIQESMFKKGYFTIDDKESIYSIGAMMDLLLFLQIKNQLDEFNNNKALLDKVKKSRNNLSFFKYRKMKKILTIYTKEEMYENLIASKSTFGDQWNSIKADLNSIHNRELYQYFLDFYYERDRELVRQAKEMLRN